MYATPELAKVSGCRHLDSAPSILDAELASSLPARNKNHPALRHRWKMTKRLRHAEKPHALSPTPALQRRWKMTEPLSQAEKPHALGPTTALQHCWEAKHLRYAEKPYEHCREVAERLRYAEKPHARRATVVDMLHLKMKRRCSQTAPPVVAEASAVCISLEQGPLHQ